MYVTGQKVSSGAALVKSVLGWRHERSDVLIRMLSARAAGLILLHWQGNMTEVLRGLVSHMDVDTLVVNTGLWSTVGEAEAAEVLDAGHAAVCGKGGGTRCFWKRTTKRFLCRGSQRTCRRGEWEAKHTPDAAMASAVSLSAAWGLYDTATATRDLTSEGYVDQIHFRPYVYAELNNLMLNVICPL